MEPRKRDIIPGRENSLCRVGGKELCPEDKESMGGPGAAGCFEACSRYSEVEKIADWIFSFPSSF